MDGFLESQQLHNNQYSQFSNSSGTLDQSIGHRNLHSNGNVSIERNGVEHIGERDLSAHMVGGLGSSGQLLANMTNNNSASRSPDNRNNRYADNSTMNNALHAALHPSGDYTESLVNSNPSLHASGDYHNLRHGATVTMHPNEFAHGLNSSGGVHAEPDYAESYSHFLQSHIAPSASTSGASSGLLAHQLKMEPNSNMHHSHSLGQATNSNSIYANYLAHVSDDGMMGAGTTHSHSTGSHGNLSNSGHLGDGVNSLAGLGGNLNGVNGNLMEEYSGHNSQFLSAAPHHTHNNGTAIHNQHNAMNHHQQQQQMMGHYHVPGMTGGNNMMMGSHTNSMNLSGSGGHAAMGMNGLLNHGRTGLMGSYQQPYQTQTSMMGSNKRKYDPGVSGLCDDESSDDDDDEGKKRQGRRKIRIEYIEDKSRRQITFSKRKAGILKKAHELSTLTGTQALLLIASETGHVYTFATARLQPLVTHTEGKALIQGCLSASDGPGGLSASGDGCDPMQSNTTNSNYMKNRKFSNTEFISDKSGPQQMQNYGYPNFNQPAGGVRMQQSIPNKNYHQHMNHQQQQNSMHSPMYSMPQHQAMQQQQHSQVMHHQQMHQMRSNQMQQPTITHSQSMAMHQNQQQPQVHQNMTDQSNASLYSHHPTVYYQNPGICVKLEATNDPTPITSSILDEHHVLHSSATGSTENGNGGLDASHAHTHHNGEEYGPSPLASSYPQMHEWSNLS